MMDMPADDAVRAPFSGFARQLPLEAADEIDGVLDLELRPCRERPIAKAQNSAHAVEMRVDEQRRFVGPVAPEREPFGVPHDDIKLIAMHDKKAASVGSYVDRIADDLNSAEGKP